MMSGVLTFGFGRAASTAEVKLHAHTGAQLGALTVQDLLGAPVRPLADRGQKATVFFFLLPDCPIANSFAPEIARIIQAYREKGVSCFVVYVGADITLVQARQHAQEYGYTSGVLLDPHQVLVKAAGATVSPEAAVFSVVGEVLYRGRIDDRVATLGQRRPEPTRRDLRLALDSILVKKPVLQRRTKAIGCYLPELRRVKP